MELRCFTSIAPSEPTHSWPRSPRYSPTRLSDPLATELVSVHPRGIERWIAQELASSVPVELGGDGICANVEFPFPANLVDAAVVAGSGVDASQDPWLPKRLTWPLLEVQERAGHKMLGPLRTNLGSAEWSLTLRAWIVGWERCATSPTFSTATGCTAPRWWEPGGRATTPGPTVASCRGGGFPC
ncbi:MAG: exodeoxyribonuclease V subunit gamma [Actinomycetota bacterium]|nr:exodeoxyribonuclease V subunit gamma [Actinomycetota bacterium]